QLTVVEHGRFVLLALADDHDAAHGYRADQLAHGIDGRAVAALLVTAADPAARGHGTCLGDPDQFQCEVAVGRLAAARGGRRCRHSGVPPWLVLTRAIVSFGRQGSVHTWAADGAGPV